MCSVKRWILLSLFLESENMTGTFPIQNLVDNKDIAVAFICFHFLSHRKETDV